MIRTKNETCFKSLRPIVADSSPDSNILDTLSAAHLQQIKKATNLQYDFSPTGVVSVVLPDRTSLAFDTNTLSDDIAETLIAACLNDKMVVGYDLYTSYTLSHCVTDDWQPNCSINIPTLRRAFRLSNPLVEGLHAIPQLMSLTGTTSFGKALEKVFDWDEACGGSFFTVCELMPCAMAQICVEAIQGMAFDGSNRLTFEGSIKSDFIKRKATLLNAANSPLLEFRLNFLPDVHQEFQLAVDSVSNALSLSWKVV